MVSPSRVVRLAHRRVMGFGAVLLAWLAVALLMASAISGAFRAPFFAREAETVSGTLIGFESGSQAPRVAYTVNGVRYEVVDSLMGAPNPDKEHATVGDSIVVFYDAAMPARAVLSDQKRRASSETIYLIVVPIVQSTFFIAGLLLLGAVAFRTWRARLLPPAKRS